MSAYSMTHDEIFNVLSAAGRDLSAREIYDAGPFERMDLVHAAVHALSQDGGPLRKITPDDGGKLRYQLREGITRETFRKPAYAQSGAARKQVAETKAAAKATVQGIAPAKPITSPAPIRADELTRKAPEAPATARTVKPMDEDRIPEGALAPCAAQAKENPGATEAPRESAPKVVSIAKPEPTRHGVDAFETIEARLRTNVEHLITAACMSADPVVRGFGVTVKELKGIRDLLKTTKGRDAA